MSNIIIKDNIIKNKLKDSCKNNNLQKTKTYKTYNNWSKITERNNAENYIAKLNIPLLPKKKQVVIGTTKFLLPYFHLKDKFTIFAVDPKKWTIDDNNNAIHTIGLLNEPIIRLVTTPDSLFDNNNKLRITSIELCILFNIYNYEIYEYINNEEYFGNIYFLIKKSSKIIIDNNNLQLINIKTKKIIYV
jgi:hypothetical protein